MIQSVYASKNASSPPSPDRTAHSRSTIASKRKMMSDNDQSRSRSGSAPFEQKWVEMKNSILNEEASLLQRNMDPANEVLTPFQRKQLQKSLQGKLSKSSRHRQRIQIILLASEGKSQAEICRILGCSQATARHWMHVASSGMAHRWQECPIGRPKKVNDEYLVRLKELVSDSPRNYGYSFRRWTGVWLSRHLAKEFGIELSGQHINRLLKQMGLSTRPKASNSENTNTLNVTGKVIVIDDIK